MAGGLFVRKFKVLIILAIIAIATGSFSLTAQAANMTVVDLTAKVDGANFWTSFYSTAFGDEETITLYKIKNVIVEIKSGTTVLDSFTFTRDSDQSHRFYITTPLQNIVIQYRANTYTDRNFSFMFDYKPGVMLTISNTASQIMAKAPYLIYH
jgi:uncharacterized protein (UPF0333 family)